MLTTALISISSFANVQIGKLYYYLDDTAKTAELTYFGASHHSNVDYVAGDLVIPENVTYNGTSYSVTSIGSFAFNGCSGLTSVVIPNSVTSIGSFAFSSCSSLTSFEIGNSVTSIGDSAFVYCSSLTSVVIPNSVTSIGEYAFNGCNGLTSFVIPNSVTSIGDGAFDDCSALTSVEIGNSVTSIGNYAFDGCSSLTSVKIPNSVTSIGDGAFDDCSALTSVEIGNSVTSIGDGAFDGCSSLTSVKIGNSVTSIGDYAFYNCSSLTSVVIPNSVTSIGDHAFSICSAMTSAKIGNSVTSIGEGAFYYCKALTNVSIPNSVTSIGEGAFVYCSGLKTIIFNSSSVLSLGKGAFNGCDDVKLITSNTQHPPVADSFDVFSNQVYSNAKLYVPEEQKDLYFTIIPWSKFRNIYGSDYTPGEEEKVYKIVPVLSPSQTLTLGVKNMDTNSLEDSFRWNSSDSYVADVNSQGIVTAKAAGETVISATNSDGDTAELEIIVIEGNEDASVNELLLKSEGNSNVYTLGGMVVIRDASQEDLGTLVPGIYIIGGKKVMVK